MGNDVLYPGCRSDRQPTQRIAVEVDRLRIGDHEPIREVGQRVGCIEVGGPTAELRLGFRDEARYLLLRHRRSGTGCGWRREVGDLAGSGHESRASKFGVMTVPA